MKYAKHGRACDLGMFGYNQQPCNCGLDDLKAKLKDQ